MRIYTHPEYLNHLVMDGHPERPERLIYLMNHLAKLEMIVEELQNPQHGWFFCYLVLIKITGNLILVRQFGFLWLWEEIKVLILAHYYQ